MFIVDDIAFFPVRSILWMLREIYNAAQQEAESEADTITNEISELYMMLETGKITEEEFDIREKELLDRLDRLQDQKLQDEEEIDEDS